MQLVLGLPSPWEYNIPGSLVVRPWTFQDAPGCARTLRVALGPEAGFRRCVDGFYVRVATLREVFAQFDTSRVREIILNWPDLNRHLFYTEQIQAHLTTEGGLQRLVMPEDSNNNEVVIRAAYRGFRANVQNDWLVITR